MADDAVEKQQTEVQYSALGGGLFSQPVGLTEQPSLESLQPGTYEVSPTVTAGGSYLAAPVNRQEVLDLQREVGVANAAAGRGEPGAAEEAKKLQEELAELMEENRPIYEYNVGIMNAEALSGLYSSGGGEASVEEAVKATPEQEQAFGMLPWSMGTPAGAPATPTAIPQEQAVSIITPYTAPAVASPMAVLSPLKETPTPSLTGEEVRSSPELLAQSRMADVARKEAEAARAALWSPGPSLFPESAPLSLSPSEVGLTTYGPAFSGSPLAGAVFLPEGLTGLVRPATVEEAAEKVSYSGAKGTLPSAAESKVISALGFAPGAVDVYRNVGLTQAASVYGRTGNLGKAVQQFDYRLQLAQGDMAADEAHTEAQSMIAAINQEAEAEARAVARAELAHAYGLSSIPVNWNTDEMTVTVGEGPSARDITGTEYIERFVESQGVVTTVQVNVGTEVEPVYKDMTPAQYRDYVKGEYKESASELMTPEATKEYEKAYNPQKSWGPSWLNYVPIVGTARSWGQSSWLERGLGIGGDVAMVIPVAGWTAKTAITSSKVAAAELSAVSRVATAGKSALWSTKQFAKMPISAVKGVGKAVTSPVVSVKVAPSALKTGVKSFAEVSAFPVAHPVQTASALKGLAFGEIRFGVSTANLSESAVAQIARGETQSVYRVMESGAPFRGAFGQEYFVVGKVPVEVPTGGAKYVPKSGVKSSTMVRATMPQESLTGVSYVERTVSASDIMRTVESSNLATARARFGAEAVEAVYGRAPRLNPNVGTPEAASIYRGQVASRLQRSEESIAALTEYMENPMTRFAKVPEYQAPAVSVPVETRSISARATHVFGTKEQRVVRVTASSKGTSVWARQDVAGYKLDLNPDGSVKVNQSGLVRATSPDKRLTVFLKESDANLIAKYSSDRGWITGSEVVKPTSKATYVSPVTGAEITVGYGPVVTSPGQELSAGFYRPMEYGTAVKRAAVWSRVPGKSLAGRVATQSPQYMNPSWVRYVQGELAALAPKTVPIAEASLTLNLSALESVPVVSVARGSFLSRVGSRVSKVPTVASVAAMSIAAPVAVVTPAVVSAEVPSTVQTEVAVGQTSMADFMAMTNRMQSQALEQMASQNVESQKLLQEESVSQISPEVLPATTPDVIPVTSVAISQVSAVETVPDVTPVVVPTLVVDDVPVPAVTPVPVPSVSVAPVVASGIVPEGPKVIPPIIPPILGGAVSTGGYPSGGLLGGSPYYGLWRRERLVFHMPLAAKGLIPESMMKMTFLPEKEFRYGSKPVRQKVAKQVASRGGRIRESRYDNGSANGYAGQRTYVPATAEEM